MLKEAVLKQQKDVYLDDGGIICVTPHGQPQPGAIQAMSAQVNTLAAKQKASHKPALVLFDMRAVVKTRSNDRLEGRRQFASLQADAVAFVAKPDLTMVMLYLVHLARPRLKVRSFRTINRARLWLHSSQRPTHARTQVGLITGLVLAAIGFSSLLGWQINSPLLTRWITNLRPINPMSAVGLIILAWGFIAYWRGTLRHLRIAGVLGSLLGLAVLLHLPISNLLYGDRVATAGPHTHIAVSAGVCFLCMGIVALIARRTEQWVRPLEYGAAALMGGLALFNVFGQLYAHDLIYRVTPNFVMAFNLAVGFGIATAGLVLLTLYRQTGKNVLVEVSRLGWIAALALVLVQAETYSVWQQAVNHNQIESKQMFTQEAANLERSVKNTIAAYTSALRGFRGFYGSSNSVSAGEFQSYYDSLNLTQNYPGLRSMAFIAAVSTKDLPAFVREQRTDTSLSTGGNPGFHIISQSTQLMHYIATYTSTHTNTGTLGLDLTSIAGRSTIYGNAIASGKDYTSGTVTFATTKPPQQGFFITIPVRNEESSKYIGVVNANFAYESFFPALLAHTAAQKDLRIDIIDQDYKTIYHDGRSVSTGQLQRNFTIPIANGGWKLWATAHKGFGLTTSQQHLPESSLIIGQLFAALLLFIFVLQTRARSQALRMVAAATADLRSERNKVVELHQRDEAMLSGLGEGLVVVDQDGKVERINPAAERMLECCAAEAQGKLFNDLIQAVDMRSRTIPLSERPLSRVLKTGQTVTAKLYYLRKDGERFPVELSLAPVIINGRTIGAIEVFRDITHELELDKAKSEFVSLASHQLRTPLSAINWYAEMLLAGDVGKLNKEQADYLREIFEGNQRMVELVNSLLNVSRIELGRMENQPAPTSIADLIASISKELTTTITTKALSVDQNLAADLPAVVADPKQLRMIVQNLLSNAVKYTPGKGKLAVTLRRATAQDLKAGGLPASRDCLLLSVQDSGYGIPKNQQAHIFEKMYRADNVRKLDVEGTGLGLYLVERVARSMGGRVWFTSMESVGSTFYVLLPVHANQPKPLKEG